MNQPVTSAPLALVVAEATKLSDVGNVALLAGELTVTVTVAKAAVVARREMSDTRRSGRILCCMDTVPFKKLPRSLFPPDPSGQARLAPAGLREASARPQFFCIFDASYISRDSLPRRAATAAG